jgi:Zn-dependent peptidase ImmA (M78 family)
MASVVAQRAIAAAHAARAQLGAALDEPLPDVLTAVEEGLGLPVVLLALPPDLAGAYVRRGPGAGFAFVNGMHATVRQRFTLCHELGHHRLGHATTQDDWSTLVDHDHDPVEVQANSFAAEFLVPAPAVAAWCAEHLDGKPTLETCVRLAAHFAVSAKAARVRLQSAGVLTERARIARLDEEIDDGAHLALAMALRLDARRDALADAGEHLPRLPAALRSSALNAYAGGAIDLVRLAALSGRPAGEMGEAVGGLGLAPGT